MKTDIHFIASFLLLTLFSCQIQEETSELDGNVLSFSATYESNTRTQLGGWNNVVWNPADEINIFCATGGGKFISTNTEITGHVVFVGSLNNVVDRGSRPYWAFYPYSEDNTFEGEAVGFSLPNEQEAVAGNVKSGLMPSMACTKSNDNWDYYHLYFYNLCGIIRIPVYEDGINKIVFKGNNDEPVAGRASASFDDKGIPFITEITNPSKEIILYPPDNGSFIQYQYNGAYDEYQSYFVVCFPGKFDKGYTIEFYRDEDLVSMKQIHTPVTLSRSGYVDLTDLYTGGTIYSVEYEGKTYSLEYKHENNDSTSYWVKIDEKVIDIPEKFCTRSIDNPTKEGPAVAIDTEHEIVYFAKGIAERYQTKGVIYRITQSGYERNEQQIRDYPSFQLNEETGFLELRSYDEPVSWSNESGYDHYIKFSNNNWWNSYGGYVDNDASGWRRKKLSDVILLFQEEDIPDYPMTMTAVDLGLSVKWSSCNMGSATPMTYGDLYAWGEITTKESFTLENYRWGGNYGSLGSGATILNCTKYNSEDQKYFLDSEDDAAHVQLGEDWRVPSPEEWQELIDNCDWKWTFLHGVLGLKGTSRKNGNCIFFPNESDLDQWYGAGLSYHTSQVCLYPYSPYCYGDYGSCGVSFHTSYYTDMVFSFGNITREFGCSIRPVYGHIPVEEILLDKETIELAPGESATLSVTVNPSNASDKNVIWSSSDESVATVSQTGVVTCVAPGKAIITVTSEDNGLSDSCVVNPYYCVTPGIVDLGLSVKWASFNLGATRPDETGFSYAWGEIKPKDEYNLFNYKWYNETSSTMTKYNGSDNKTVLESKDDAAFMNLGGKWRMPTKEEIEELIENCDISTDKLNNIDVLRVTNRVNGKSMYLPYNSGSYWASTIDSGSNSSDACYLLFHYSWEFAYAVHNPRFLGLLIRPVYDDSQGNEGITPGGDINM